MEAFPQKSGVIHLTVQSDYEIDTLMVFSDRDKEVLKDSIEHADETIFVTDIQKRNMFFIDIKQYFTIKVISPEGGFISDPLFMDKQHLFFHAKIKDNGFALTKMNIRQRFSYFINEDFLALVIGFAIEMIAFFIFIFLSNKSIRLFPVFVLIKLLRVLFLFSLIMFAYNTFVDSFYHVIVFFLIAETIFLYFFRKKFIGLFQSFLLALFSNSLFILSLIMTKLLDFLK